MWWWFAIGLVACVSLQMICDAVKNAMERQGDVLSKVEKDLKNNGTIEPDHFNPRIPGMYLGALVFALLGLSLTWVRTFCIAALAVLLLRAWRLL